MWLRLIGPPGLFSAPGRVHRLATKKQTALLVYLNAVPGHRGVRRDEIIELLWPSLTSPKGRQSLSQGLSEIRHRLGHDAVSRGGTHVHLLRPLPTDVTDLRRLTVDARTAMALEGLEDVAGPDFAHWVEATRVTITNDLRRRLNSDIDRLRSQGNQTAVRERADQLYRIDPTNVRATYILAEAAAHEGDTDKALSLLHEILRDQSLLTEEETRPLRELRARLQSVTHPDVHRVVVTPPPILAGRQRELHRLHAAAAKAKSDIKPAVLVIGAPGLGKSVLVERFLADRTADGGLCIHVRCYDRAHKHAVARGTIHALLSSRDLGSTPPQSMAALCRVAPFLRHAYPGIPEDKDAREVDAPTLAFSLANALEAVASGTHVFMNVEDIDLADSESVSLVISLLHQPLPFAFTLVATTSHHAPLAVRKHREIDRLPWTDILELRPLANDAANHLIRIMSQSNRGKLPRGAITRLVRWCQGSPLLIRLAISDLFTNGTRSFAYSYDPANLHARWRPSPAVCAQLERRFGTFWSARREIIELLALSVRPLAETALSRMTSRNAADVRTALQTGVAMGILASAERGFVFPSGILRAFVASRMSPNTRSLYHRMLANHLIRHWTADQHPPLDALQHLRAVGDHVVAAQFVHRVARLMIDHGRPRIAERVLRRSLRDAREACHQTSLLLAQALLMRGKPHAAVRTLQRLDLTKLGTQDVAHRDYLVREAGNIIASVGTPLSSRAWKRSSSTSATGTDEMILLQTAETAARVRDWPRLRAVVRAVHAGSCADRNGIAQLTLAFCQMTQGFYQQAVGSFQRSVIQLARQQRTLYEARALNGLGTCAFARGRFSSAVAAFTRAFDLAQRADNTSFAAAVASNLGAVYTDYDFPKKAAQWLTRSSDLLGPPHGHSKYRSSVLANLMDHAVVHGQTATPLTAGHSELAEGHPGGWFDSYLRCGRADQLLAQEDWDTAMREVAIVIRVAPGQLKSTLHRYIPGFDSPHLARLMFLNAWHHGNRGEVRQFMRIWPNRTMSLSQQAELTAVFGWCAEHDDPDDRAKTARRYYQRAGTIVQQHGLSGVLRRLHALGLLTERLQRLIR